MMYGYRDAINAITVRGMLPPSPMQTSVKVNGRKAVTRHAVIIAGYVTHGI
jgi:hypothetical protein